MSGLDVIRAWKDENYRLGLSSSERESVPENPAGMIDLTDSNLDAVAAASIEDFLNIFTYGDSGFCEMLLYTFINISSCKLSCDQPPKPPI